MAQSNGEHAPGLTERQIELIHSSWALVKPNMQEAGLIMFYKLFEIDPSLQDLFSFKGERLCDENEGLRKHALGVMETVDVAINSLDNIPALQDTLMELGMIHAFKSVKTIHFAPVGHALLYALATGLKEAFTDEVKKAWIALYSFVNEHMSQGMEVGEDEED